MEVHWSSHTMHILVSTSGGPLELVSVLAVVQWFARLQRDAAHEARERFMLSTSLRVFYVCSFGRRLARP